MSQSDPPAPGEVLAANTRQQVLEALVRTLDRYVFPEVAERLKADICDRISTDGYQDIHGGPQLADTLTAQLQALSGDSQLRLHFSPQPLPDLHADSAPSSEDLARQQRLSALRNFDFNALERRAGNVGYLQLFGFEPPEFAGATAAAAMEFLAHTSALIFDLRHNTGGSPAMVALLASYLFPPYPALHFSDLYWRSDDSTRQWWSQPHLPAPRYLERPVLVLTSPKTAAAAEEFAYLLQRRQRAKVVGETTRGSAHPGHGHRLHEHFWLFVPSGRTYDPTTGKNWHGSGVVPDAKVPSELAVTTAHLLVVTQLLETAEGGHLRELQATAVRLQQQLERQRHDLISQLGGKP